MLFYLIKLNGVFSYIIFINPKISTSIYFIIVFHYFIHVMFNIL